MADDAQRRVAREHLVADVQAIVLTEIHIDERDVDAMTRQYLVERLGAAADTEHAHVRVAFEAVSEQLTDETMVVENEDVVRRR